jgi:hypothetical protein
MHSVWTLGYLGTAKEKRQGGYDAEEDIVNSVSPVLTDREIEAEQVIALDQPQYYPIIVCRVNYQDKDGNPNGKATLTRFRFTDEERARIAKGADLILSQPHHGSLMPIGLELAMPEEYP